MRSKLVLSNFFPFRVTALAEGMSRSLSQRYRKPYDISVPEWRIMACLNYAKTLTAGELRTKTCMEKPRVSRALNKMEARDFIKKVPDAIDNRKTNIQLTKKGRTLYNKIEPIARKWEFALLEDLSEDEVKCVHLVLDKLSSKLEKLSDSRKTNT